MSVLVLNIISIGVALPVMMFCLFFIAFQDAPSFQRSLWAPILNTLSLGLPFVLIACVLISSLKKRIWIATVPLVYIVVLAILFSLLFWQGSNTERAELRSADQKIEALYESDRAHTFSCPRSGTYDKNFLIIDEKEKVGIEMRSTSSGSRISSHIGSIKLHQIVVESFPHGISVFEKTKKYLQSCKNADGFPISDFYSITDGKN